MGAGLAPINRALLKSQFKGGCFYLTKTESMELSRNTPPFHSRCFSNISLQSRTVLSYRRIELTGNELWVTG